MRSCTSPCLLANHCIVMGMEAEADWHFAIYMESMGPINCLDTALPSPTLAYHGGSLKKLAE